MKKLKKILLINWLYFSKEIIEVGDVNFLTGKNGAGKSTVIDALQIVLLGETNARNFNQAANEKSQRTLDGYLRADMDENNPYSRRGKDFSSYIACEFQDDVAGSSFVTGIVFDCRSDGSRQDRFFIYVGTLPENCFVENGEAMEIPALRRFLKQNYAKAEIYDTQKEYRRNMLSRWNVHNEQILRMMKKAVSFRPIVDIQKFITENICDIPEKPDIEAMQQNIRDYKRHEMLAQRQEEKLIALQEISKLYREMNQAIDRWRVQSFLALWSKKEMEQAQIDRFELEKSDCNAELATIEKSITTISDRITQKENRRRELDLACAQSSVFQEEEKLRNRKQTLLDEKKRLTQDLQALAMEIKRESLQLNTVQQDHAGQRRYCTGELSYTAKRSQSTPDAGGSDLSVWPEPESKAGGRTGAFLQNQYHSGASGYWKDTDDPKHYCQCCSERTDCSGRIQQQFCNAQCGRKAGKEKCSLLDGVSRKPCQQAEIFGGPDRQLSGHERLGNTSGGTAAIGPGNDHTLQRTERNARCQEPHRGN